MSLKDVQHILLARANGTAEAASPAELGEMVQRFLLGQAVAQLRQVGVADEDIRATFESAMKGKG